MRRMREIRLSGGAQAGIVPSMRLLLFLLRALQAQRTRAELRALSDRTLRDIGLERGQIERLFR
jgi:uncharacterized protein YjiS (DUF1127 family)